MGWLIGLARNTNRVKAAGCGKAGGAPVPGRVLRPPQRRRVGGWLAATAMVAALSSLAVFAGPPLQHSSVGPVTPLWDAFPSGTYASRGAQADKPRHVGASPDGSRVYALRDGTIAAFDSTTGDEIWTSAGVLGAVRELGVSADDSVVGLYQRQDESLQEVFVVAFDGATGAQLWRETIGFVDDLFDNISAGSLAVHSSSGLIAANWWEFVGNGEGAKWHFAMLDPATGSTLWSRPLTFSLADFPANSVVVVNRSDLNRGLAFSPSGQQVFALLQPKVGRSRADWDAFTVVAFDAATGQEQWSRAWVNGYIGNFFGVEEFIPFGHSSPFALDVSPDGSTVVAVGITHSICFPETSPVSSITSGESKIAAFAYDAATGSPMWNYLPDAEGGDPTKDPCLEGDDAVVDVAISAAGQVIMAGQSLPPDPVTSVAYDAYTAALDLVDGTPLWTHRAGRVGIGGQLEQHVQLTPDDGTAVVASSRQIQPDEPSCGFGTYPAAVAIATANGTTVWSDLWTPGCEFGTQGRYQDAVLSPDGGTLYALSLLVAGVVNVQGLTALGFDTIGPDVGIGFAPVPIGVFENGTLTATANDENTGGSNIDGIEFQIDGGAWSPMPPLDDAYDSILETGIQSVSFATEGTHQACVRATDVSGNLGDPLCMDIEVVAGDSTPPVITQFDVQPNPVDVGETAMLSVQASDATTGNSQIVIIEYQVDGGPWTSIIPPADGAYDEATEEGEADLVFDSEGIHDVCVRAADAANNVSTPECVDVSAEGPVGLMVKCLHEPLYPQAGEEVAIRASALDRDGNAVFADRLEIYLNDRETPFVFEGMVQGGTFRFTADDKEFLYGCAAKRGNESAFSRFVSVDTGEPELSDFDAIPVLYHGSPHRKIDLVFMADANTYPGGPLDPDFLEHMQLIISDGLFEIPWFVEHQWILNIWLATDTAGVEPKNPDKVPPPRSICKKDKPPRYRRRYAFADAVGIIHQQNCRDNWIPPGPFTTEFDDEWLQVVAHEIGHAVFKLSDEYTTSPTIRFTVPEFPNLLPSLEVCQIAALSRGKDPDQCRPLPGFTLGGIFIFEPDYNIGTWNEDAVRDLMQQTGAGPCSFDANRTCQRYRVGDSEEARVKWKLGKCIDGNC